MLTNKKPFYKKWWFIAIVLVCVAGMIADVSRGGQKENVMDMKLNVETEVPVVKEVVKRNTPVKSVKPIENKEPFIDTSFFKYATDAEVTDAIDINKHVTVQLTVSEDTQPGMAVQNILTQSFDFLQQDVLAGAETVTIFVTQNEKKIVQYTVNKNDFVPNETDPMGNLVLKASEVEMMSKEVKEFGSTMGWPL